MDSRSAAPRPARPAAKWTTSEGLDPVRVRMLTTACTQLAAEHGQPMRRRQVRQRVIRLLRGGYADVEMKFLRNDLGILDPVGVTASANVDRERGVRYGRS